MEEQRRLFGMRLYVVLNAADDSVTFSPALLRKIRRHTKGDLRVLTLAVKDTSDYCFFVAPKMEELKEEVQLPLIQYDIRTKEYGYHCFSPTVNKMLYGWGLEPDSKVKCRVSRKRLRGQWCYIIHGERWEAL